MKCRLYDFGVNDLAVNSYQFSAFVLKSECRLSHSGVGVAHCFAGRQLYAAPSAISQIKIAEMRFNYPQASLQNIKQEHDVFAVLKTMRDIVG